LEPERRNFVKNVTVLSEDSEVIMFRADEQYSYSGEEKNVPFGNLGFSPSKSAK
jgi:hypothetical protein